MAEYVDDYSSKKWLNEISHWKQEHPLAMRPNDRLSPVDIINAINQQFDEAIIVTDVGQHQMLVSQYAEITPGKQQLIMSGGLGTMGYGFPGGVGAKIGDPGQAGYRGFRRRRNADEYPGIRHCCSGRASTEPLLCILH